jgi:hypothetical protein
VVVDFKKPVKQDNKEEAYDETKEYPEVLFTSGVRRVITPEEWGVEGTRARSRADHGLRCGTSLTHSALLNCAPVAGEQQACRVQCPLALAWALSIHKAQGMCATPVISAAAQSLTVACLLASP